YVLLTVTDSGVGMDEEIQERIFEPFFTTKEMGQGTGLGLASVYGIIKSHHGYIEVESSKGKGTTFRIYLPASEKEIQKTVETTDEIVKGAETVLLVDDEDIILEVSCELLETIGYRVLTAGCGKESIEIYKNNRDKIDIVVLDMVMPDINGAVVYKRLKEINPDVKVLLSSGYSIDGHATEILNQGCDGFIQKPFTLQSLSRKIKDILEKDFEPEF
ncbi:MAG: response regulator, partial [Desulfobulbaceae bacterium]|nr:response regulator [Desulfobulbaceae bacterium]